jgi:hypothetical protein
VALLRKEPGSHGQTLARNACSEVWPVRNVLVEEITLPWLYKADYIVSKVARAIMEGILAHGSTARVRQSFPLQELV